jgi:small conductance mechanosensitive channel
MTGSDQLARTSDWLIAKPTSIILLVIVGFIVRWVLHRVIDRLTQHAATVTVPEVFKGATATKARELLLEAATLSAERRQQRANTMASMLKSITTAVVFSIVAFMAAAELGYDIAPLIASAGIIGVALSLGAQSLIKDFLSGIAMMWEDQFGVGDAVDVGAATGTVEAVGLRVTRLRDDNGITWYVRNGEILRVGNLSEGWARTVLDVSVGFSADLDRVQEVLREAVKSVWEDSELRPYLLEEPEVLGVERWEADGVVVQVAVKTSPDDQRLVAGAMRESIMAGLEAAQIETPLPQRVVWHRYEATDSAE